MDRKLGRGLSSLIGYTKRDEVMMISVDKITPSQFQPRRRMDERSLRELAESIKSKGVIEPIIVRLGKNGYYELICGERRWRACKLAGMDKIPAIVRNLSDEDAFEVSLIENIQREDLSPMEFALAFDKLVKMGRSHDEIARKIGKSRSWVTNVMRILRLPDDVRRLIDEGKISLGHAKVLCSIKDERLVRELAEKIVGNGMSVRELEEIAEKQNTSNTVPKIKKEIENKLRELFPQSTVKVKVRKDGRIEVKLMLSPPYNMK